MSAQKHPSQLSISDFTYTLPEERIAKYPLPERDSARLLIYRNSKIQEDTFKNLDQFLEPHTLLVFNETKVIQARLNFLNHQQQNIEIFCLEPVQKTGDLAAALNVQGSARWNCLIGNLRRWKTTDLNLTADNVQLTARIIERKEGFAVIDFLWSPPHFSFAEILQRFGNMPIPPYLNRKSETTDTERYQTFYSKNEGSVAAPTAGLHFSGEVLTKIEKRGISSLALTLHVGAGTFKPVKSLTMEGHDMHAEWMNMSITHIQQVLDHLDKPIIAVGTTSLRTLETLYWMGYKVLHNPGATLRELEITQWEVYGYKGDLPGAKDCLAALIEWMKKNQLKQLMCETQILIAPPYELKVASGIITNFHQPQSTLLLLVAAVVGKAWRDIYTYALQNQFRFLSYGDSSLLLK